MRPCVRQVKILERGGPPKDSLALRIRGHPNNIADCESAMVADAMP